MGTRRCADSRFRDEFLNGDESESMADARAQGASWQRAFNTMRPQISLAHKTPKEVGTTCGQDSIGRASK